MSTAGLWPAPRAPGPDAWRRPATAVPLTLTPLRRWGRAPEAQLSPHLGRTGQAATAQRHRFTDSPPRSSGPVTYRPRSPAAAAAAPQTRRAAAAILVQECASVDRPRPLAPWQKPCAGARQPGARRALGRAHPAGRGRCCCERARQPASARPEPEKGKGELEERKEGKSICARLEKTLSVGLAVLRTCVKSRTFLFF